MKKNGFTIIEIVIVFLLILGVVFLILPSSLNNTKQARLIAKWAQSYSSYEYMFSVIKAQNEMQLNSKITNAKDNKDVNRILIDIIKPYLRTTTRVENGYIPYFMNGQAIDINSQYYISDFYNTSSKEIVGLKWLDKNCDKNTVCGIVAVDINGILPPNKWGFDIFGINLKRDSIEPMGKSVNADMLRTNCSKNGDGTDCAYYYLIGGRFD